MIYSCRNVGKERPVPVPSNKFEVLKNRIMQRGKGSGREITKNRKKILREEKVKRGVEVRRHKFKRTKLERLVYVRNVNSMLNYARPIIDTVEVEIFFKGHKERTSIDVIKGQK